MKYIVKYFIFLICFYSHLLAVKGQDTNVVFGSIQEKMPNSKPIDFFQLEKNCGFIIGEKKTKLPYKFLFFDSSLTLISESEIKFSANAGYVQSIFVNKQLHFFCSKTNELGEQELLVQKVGENGLISVPSVLTKYKNNGGYKTAFKVSVSSDHKKIVVLVEQPFQKDKKEKITLIVFDETLKLQKITTKTLDVMVKHKRKNFPIIANDGSVYVLKKFYNKKSQFYIYFFNNETKEQAKISLRNRDVISLMYTISDEGVLNVFGFFSSPLHANYEGVFSLRYNKSVHPEFRNEVFLTEKMVHSFKSKKEIKSKGYGLDNFHLKSIIVDSLNNTFLIAEHFKINNEKNITEHYRKGLIVVRFNKKGNFVWGEPLLLEQHEKYEKKKNSWSSSIPFIFNNKLNVIHNSVNYKAKKNDPVLGNTIFNSHWASFDKNGMATKNIMTKINEFSGERMSLMPKLISQGENELMLLMQNENKNKFRLIKISLK